MKQRTIATAVCVGAVVVLAGCGGAPAQPGSLDKPSSAPSSDAAAPKIANPADVSQYVQNPCGLTPSSAMSGIQLHQIKVATVGKRPDGQPHKICHFGSTETATTGFGVSLLGMGLDAQYQKQKTVHFFQTFEPTDINGFPAVNTTKPDDKKDGRSSLIIGLNDRESADIQVTAQSPSEAKQITDTVAKTIVDTARSGGK